MSDDKNIITTEPNSDGVFFDTAYTIDQDGNIHFIEVSLCKDIRRKEESCNG